MSKLNVDQKTIKDLFQSKKSDFLIPDYQRPYAWGEAECRTLWDDIFSFAIPMKERQNLIVIASISSVRLLLLEMRIN